MTTPSVMVERRGKAVTAHFAKRTSLSVAHRALSEGLAIFGREARVKVAPQIALGSEAPFFVVACDVDTEALRDAVMSASVNALRGE